MRKTKIFFLLVTIYQLPLTPLSAPIEETRDLNSVPEPEDRRHHNRRKRPCRRDNGAEGRTFFDWNYSYVNVNHNYIVNCGGYGGHFGGGQRPPGGIHGSHGGGPGIFGSHGGGNHHGSGGNIGSHGGGGGLLGSHGGGGGLLGSHGGGNGGSGSGGNHGSGGGLFGLGLFDWLSSHRPSTTRPEKPPEADPEPENPQVPEDKPDYQDDKPVHEDYDDIVPEGYQNWKPGQYVTAYNPIFGSYVQDVTNFNPNKLLHQVNREVNKFFRPLYHLFRR